LRVQSAYGEPGTAAATVIEPLASELRLLAHWLQLETIAVADRGDLARPLGDVLRN
jgi:uncharacterized protein YcaQ